MAEDAELVETFGAVTQALAQANVDAAFIGAIAVIAWSRVRTTTDVDLVISASPADLERLRPCLERLGFTVGAPVTSEPAEAVPDISVFWSGHRPSVRVDVFHAKTDFEREALRLAVPAEVAGQRVRVATAEAVIVYKVLASRAKDELDLRAVFEAAVASKRVLDWASIDRWCGEWGIAEKLAPWRHEFKAATS
ncbi:MAG: nucleotidyltransferase [Archangium sp.]|nr:nucleotidyltransferase [Archangium sp.]